MHCSLTTVPVALRKESVDRNGTDSVSYQYLSSSLSARRAWIEIFVPFDVIRPAMSLSARRAWIEISMSCNAVKFWAVALRKESVDRNTDGLQKVIWRQSVALRKESVDRNGISGVDTVSHQVALRKESVDRNIV